VAGSPGTDEHREGALVELRELSVTRGEVRLLDRVDFSLVPGENWVLLGPNGSGKSSFIRVVRGDLWPDQDGRSVRLYRSGDPSAYRWLPSPIGFRERTGLVSPELQDTYLRLEIDLTVLSVVLAGFHDTLRPLTAPTFNQLERVRAMLSIVGADHLTDRPYLTLSRGEGRKVLLARALAPGPAILFLDEPCAGLDRRSCRELIDLLDSLAAKGQQYFMATHRPSEIPATANRRARMDRGRLVPEGMSSGGIGRGSSGTLPALFAGPEADGRPGDPLIEIENGSVFYRGRRALHHISWSVRRGEHWAVIGPNGSGKSTLLKLILGYVHPAVGGTIRRGVGTRSNDLREVRRAIGWVSPEQQAAFDPKLTVEEAVLTGVHGGDRLPSSSPDGQREHCRDVLSLLGLSPLGPRTLSSLSYGQLRQVLLARALATGPELLLLDEPLSGLDPEARQAWTSLLSAAAAQGATLVVTSHYAEDIPPVVTHVLELDKGRIARKGARGNGR
jgi:molybdate transport system ATP-binding protein